VAESGNRSKQGDSLFDGASYKLGALRSADERHAIAKLDVAIEMAAAEAQPDGLIEALVAARENVLERMVDLSRRLELLDESRANALALAEAVRRVIA
jgi:hypothetical protein